MVNGICPPIENLNVSFFLQYRYGHAIFDFIVEEHGPEGLRSFLFEFRKVLLTGNLEKAIKESFGYDVDDLQPQLRSLPAQEVLPGAVWRRSLPTTTARRSG